MSKKRVVMSKNVKRVRIMEKSYKQSPEFGAFKGNATISLPLIEGSDFKFTFGLTKAKLILEYLEEIKGFINKHDKEKEEE